MDISRVLFSIVALPRLRAVIYLGRLLPNASSGSVLGTGKRTNRSSFDLAPNRGLPSQRLSTLLVRSYRTFAPLPPARGDLTRGERNYREPLTRSQDRLLPAKAVCFCGTLLTVTRTGRYPASLVFREPGLSSDQSKTNLQPPAPTLSLALV